MADGPVAADWVRIPIRSGGQRWLDDAVRLVNICALDDELVTAERKILELLWPSEARGGHPGYVG